MKNITIYALGIIFLASCSTSNEVVKNGLFQKRKYNKGWYINSSKSVKNNKSIVTEDEDVALENNSINEVSSELNNNLVDNTSNTVVKEEVQDLAFDNTVKEEKKSNFITVFKKKTESKNNESQVNSINDNTIAYQSEAFDYITKAEPTKVDKADKTNGGGSLSTNKLLLIIIAIFISWLAVGLYTGWDTTPTLINLILWFLFILPGFIHALLIILDVI